MREARLAARISHPNVVQVYDVGQWRGTHYIAMEYVDGRSLEEILVTDGALAERDAVRVGVQMAAALQAAVAKGIVHRDIKPGNILFRRDGSAKLADLGLAVAPGDAVEGLVGTPYYISPEQAASAPNLDVRSDIYSLGCTLYHAVTGAPPFAGATAFDTLRLHAEAPRPNARLLRPALTPRFCALLQRMMAVRPKDRHQTPEDLSEDLEAVLSPRPSKRADRLIWAFGIVLAVVALLMLVLTLVVVLGRSEEQETPSLDSRPPDSERWQPNDF